jgi:hypothetical protein
VVGVSATFRSEIGIKKINQMIPGSIFINSPIQCREKEMQLEVFGKLSPAVIIERAISLAQEKSTTMPVIVICSDFVAC